jgi:Helix-hairpin-helix domain
MDLSDISGIGPARARWLEEELGVRSIRDLAELSTADIERISKEHAGGKVSRATVEGWVAEARSRLSEEESETAVAAGVQAGGKASEPRQADTWRPVASFVVEFQSKADGAEGEPAPTRTAVHYVEEDRNQTWAGWDHESLCRWFTEQAGTIEAAGQPPSSERTEGTTGLDVEQGEGAVEAEEPPRGEAPGTRFSVHLIDGDGITDSHLVRIDRPWSVLFAWSLPEPMPADARGEWWLDFLLTPVGRGAPLRIRKGAIRLPAARPWTRSGYRHRLDVPVGIATVEHVDALYRGSATMMFVSKTADRVSYPGSTDLGVVRFYEPSGSPSSRGSSPRATSAPTSIHGPR